MDWSSFAVLVIAGIVGAWIGMRVSRVVKRRSRTREEEE
jgi:uncharacterized membrane protein YfcA